MQPFRFDLEDAKCQQARKCLNVLGIRRANEKKKPLEERLTPEMEEAA